MPNPIDPIELIDVSTPVAAPLLTFVKLRDRLRFPLASRDKHARSTIDNELKESSQRELRRIAVSDG